MSDIKPWDDSGSDTPLIVRASVSSPTGWIDLNDHERYELEATSRNNRSVKFRRQEVTSPYLPGTWLINAVPDMISEVVSVWVRGTSHFDLTRNVSALEDAFSQLSFTIRWATDDSYEEWMCQLSDYTIATQREYQHARVAKFTAEVPRYPWSSIRQVIPGTSITAR